MPENIIAKKLNIELDSINQKVKIIKDFIVVIGDSIEITINLKENGVPKNINNCVCRLIGIKENSEPFEQTEKIEIIDSLNGVVKIYPRLDIFNVEGKTICCLLVEDADETISVQRFIINVTKSMVSDLIIESKDEIGTLKKLNDLLDSYQNDLSMINKSVTNMENLVTQKTNEVNSDFGELSDGIHTQIDELQDSINGVNNTVNYELTKRIKLKPYRLVGSNYIYLMTDEFNEPAKNLLNQQYLVSIGGIVSSDTFNSATFILTFNLYNNRINPFTVNLNDRTIDGKSLNATIVYNDLSNSVEPNSTGYKLFVKSNILKDLNLDSDCYGYMTPLA